MPVHWAVEGDLVSLTFDGEYSFDDIAQAAGHGLQAVAGPVAIVATPGAMYGIARQIGQQAEVPDALTVRVFDRLADARDWLERGALPD